MSSDTLLEDLEHRRDLAVELARYADGREGLGLGTALAGLLALLDLALLYLVNGALARYAALHATREEFPHFLVSRLFVVDSALVLAGALLWLLLRGPVQRVYRRHGEAGSPLPVGDLRLGTCLMALMGFAGAWIGRGNLMAVSHASEAPHALWGGPMLKVMGALAFVGTLILAAMAWRRLGGWRTWMSWIALCAPFFILAAAPLLDGRYPGILLIVLMLSLAAAALYLPFLCIYTGLRDHLHYRRLLGELGALAALEGA